MKGRHQNDGHPKCPACGSDNTRYQCRGRGNEIVGPGARYIVEDEWFSCKDCGIRFDEIEEK